MKYYKFYLLSLAIIILDQAIKLLVFYNMELGEHFSVFGDWFKIHYTVNPGMAFGLRLDWTYGKLLLTIFRLLAMLGIGYYLYLLAKRGVHQGLVWCVALILGGAVGNVIDSTLYGVLLDNAPEGAPSAWFHGQVIDMFYVDIWEGYVADWVPFWGGTYKSLWPIFNTADASIFVGVTIILIMQKRFFADKKTATEELSEETTAEADSALETETKPAE
ncbi:lipoprotein signal peptidase [Fulvivirgaceae bacterium BMA10]|uniref:Lipoprotein signal peptidase n=1 Tax=Splendidivirga corallicola TaxID=3051826 RepID=A0ABT8KMP2_9BACT|nr:lipoprotein signal peptidase [Fulvivirgaceae bacterium BMA10]